MESKLPEINDSKESEIIQTSEVVGEDVTTHETSSFDVRHTAGAIAKPRLSLLQSFDPLFSTNPVKGNNSNVEIEGILNNLTLTNKNNVDFTNDDKTTVTAHVEDVSKLVDISFVNENLGNTSAPSENSPQKSSIQDNSQIEDEHNNFSSTATFRQQLVIDESESDLSTSRLDTGEKSLFEESDIEFEDAIEFVEKEERTNDIAGVANLSNNSVLKEIKASLETSLPEVVEAAEGNIPITEVVSSKNGTEISINKTISKVSSTEQSELSPDFTGSYFDNTRLEETVIYNIAENSTVSPSLENSESSTYNTIQNAITQVENCDSIHKETSSVVNPQEDTVPPSELDEQAITEQSPDILEPCEFPEQAITAQSVDRPKPCDSTEPSITVPSTDTPKPCESTEPSITVQSTDTHKPCELTEPSITVQSGDTPNPRELIEDAISEQIDDTIKPSESTEQSIGIPQPCELTEPSITAQLADTPNPCELIADAVTEKLDTIKPCESIEVSTEDCLDNTSELTVQLADTPKPCELTEPFITVQSADTPNPCELIGDATTEQLDDAIKPSELIKQSIGITKPCELTEASITVQSADTLNPCELIADAVTEKLDDTIKSCESIEVSAEDCLDNTSELTAEIVKNIPNSPNLNETFDFVESENIEEPLELEKSQPLNDCNLQSSQIKKDLDIPITAGQESVIPNSALEEKTVCVVNENKNSFLESQADEQVKSPKRESSGQYFSKIKDFLTSVVASKRESTSNPDTANHEDISSEKNSENVSINKALKSPLEEAISSAEKEEICNDIPKENLNASVELRTVPNISADLEQKQSHEIIVLNRTVDKEVSESSQIKEDSISETFATPKAKSPEPLQADGNIPIIGQEIVDNCDKHTKEDSIPIIQELPSPNKTESIQNISVENLNVDSQNIIVEDITASNSPQSSDSVVTQQEKLLNLSSENSDKETVDKVILPEDEDIIEEDPNHDIENLKVIVDENINSTLVLEENVKLDDDVKDSKNQQNQSIKNTVTEKKDHIPTLEASEETNKPHKSIPYIAIGKFTPGKRNTRSLSPKHKAHFNIGRSASPLGSSIHTKIETASITVESKANVGEVKKIEETAELIDISNKESDKRSNNSENTRSSLSRDSKVKQATPARRSFLKDKSPKTPLLGFNQLIDSELIPSPIRSILDCVPINDNSEDEKENKEGAAKSQPVKYKMSDLMDKLSSLHQEISDLKLQLNASQQEKASLELEIRQKEEVIIKTQAEALKKEQDYVHDIKNLKEQLAEKSKIIEKDSTRELELEFKKMKAREAEVLSELNARNNDELNFKKIMEEYEKTISGRLADFEKLKAEHETATKHLANLEFAFADVHQKYERSKAIIEGFKTNEETLRHNLSVLEQTIKHHEEKYESLKAHAKAQIEKSNKEILMLRDRYEAEHGKMNAVIRRLEIKCAALDVSLEQKSKECSALAALCDEVTGKRV